MQLKASRNNRHRSRKQWDDTSSPGFPTLNQYQTDAQTDNSTLSDVFVTKINTNASGNASLLYSTYPGGDGNDAGANPSSSRLRARR
ncbi:MAG: hypothetical protein WBP93_02575 [Pyrinomonadaceae bacterium]